MIFVSSIFQIFLFLLQCFKSQDARRKMPAALALILGINDVTAEAGAKFQESINRFVAKKIPA